MNKQERIKVYENTVELVNKGTYESARRSASALSPRTKKGIIFVSTPITGADFFSLSGCCLFPAFTLK